MPHKTRIALLGPWKWTKGGVTTFMTNVVDSPLAGSYEFLRFNTARPPKPNVTDNYGYAAIWRGGVGRLFVGGIITLMHLALFPFWLVARRPSLVQVQSSDFHTFWESAFYVVVCRVLRVPVVERLGGAFDNFYSVSSARGQALIRRVLAWPDGLIVQSAYWRELVARLGRSDGVHVVPNWVADGLVVPAARTANATPICLFGAGSEAARKGLDEVVEAAAVLKAESANVRIRIVAANEKLGRRIAETNVADIVELEGYVDRDRMIQEMRSADIFLLPSHAEGFPNALLEAMATGIAAIVTPVGAIPEIVSGGAALVVAVGDKDGLAQEISKLSRSEKLRATIGARALHVVQSRYVESVALPSLESAWLSLLTREPQQGPEVRLRGD